MNKTYKVLFNRVRGVATAVSEIASSHQARKKATAIVAVVVMELMTGSAIAEVPPSLYGATAGNDDGSTTIPTSKVDRDSEHGVTTSDTKATNTGAYFTVKGNGWDKIYGGYSTNGNATQNQVYIEGADGTLASIYGGYTSAAGGAADLNTVSMSANADARTVYGGAGASASYNIVSIEGAKVHGYKFVSSGTEGYGKIYGGHVTAGTGSARNNTVHISGTGTLIKWNDDNGGMGVEIIGGYASGTGQSASDNEVTIDGGKFTQDVTNSRYINIYGGRAKDLATANKNRVEIKGMTEGSVHDVFGGYSYDTSYYGHKTEIQSSEVSGNEVTVSGGTISGSVCGGYSKAEHTVTSEDEWTATATSGGVHGNTVTVSGGTIKDIYGGLSEATAKTPSKVTCTSGDVYGNTVKVSAGTVSGTVYGGNSNNGSAGTTAGAGNSVILSGNATLKNESVSVMTGTGYFGAFGGLAGGTSANKANYNTVTIKDSTSLTYKTDTGTTVADGATAYAGVFGGFNASTDPLSSASHNKVSIDGGQICLGLTGDGWSHQGIYGGYTISGSANDNIVDISKGTIGAVDGNFQIVGGNAFNGAPTASNNKITIRGGKIIANQLTGGNAAIAAENNTVEITGMAAGSSVSYVYGATTQFGPVHSNRVTISDTVGDGVVIGGVYGGSTCSGSAGVNVGDGNNVSISGGTIKGPILGALVYGSDGGSANYNTVSISGSATIDATNLSPGEMLDITGGSTQSKQVGKSAAYNTVTISGGTFIQAGSGNVDVYGGQTIGSISSNVVAVAAYSNSVEISETATNSAARNVYGGYSYAPFYFDGTHGSATSGEVQDNSVIVSAGTISDAVYGGYSNAELFVLEGESTTEDTVKSGDVHGNTVTVNGGTIKDVYGGYSSADTEGQGTATSGSANNNTVIFNGGSATEVTGGNAIVPGASAKYNAVIWKGGTISFEVCGGAVNSTAPATASVGNTLVVVGSGKSTQRLSDFQNYLFLLDGTTNNIKNTSTAAFTSTMALTDNLVLGLTETEKVGVTLAKDATINLKKNDKIVLMTVKSGLTDASTNRANQVSDIRADLSGNTSASTWLNSNIEVESKVNKYEFALANEDLWVFDATDENSAGQKRTDSASKETIYDQDVEDYRQVDPIKDSLVATVTNVAPTLVVSDLRQIADGTSIAFRNQMNDVSLRMGELRTSNSDGAWARLYGGAYKLGSGMRERSLTLQIGVDKWFTSNTYFGLTGAYTRATDTLTQGDNKQKNWNVGFYGGYVAESGLFVDAIVKHGRIKNDFSLSYESGEPSSGKYSTRGTSFSIEGGWRFLCPKTSFYVEPQLELMFGHLESAKYTAGEVNFKNDAVNNFVGRIGAAAGFKFAEDRGNLYLKTSLLHDFKGKVKTEATVVGSTESDGGSTRDLGGTWGEFVLGGNVKAMKNLSVYGEMMISTQASGVRTKWQGSAGVRYTF